MRGDGRSIWADVRLSSHGVCLFDDATARREAHEDLRQSEERLRTMVQTSHEGIWILGPDDLTTFVNARMAEMLACTVDEMLGRPITDFLDDDEAKKALARLAGRRRGVADQYELKWRAPDGREVWTIMNASPLFDPDGSYAGAFAMATDISERMWHERAVRASEERYRNIIETTTEGVWMIDGDHRTTYVNRRMAQMLGYGVEEMLGRPVADFMPDGADAAGLGHDPGGAGGRPREVRYMRKDGGEMWGLLSGSPLADAARRIRRRARDDRRHHRPQALRGVGRAARGDRGVVARRDLLHRPRGRITSWNSAAERIYGYSEEEVLGQSGWLLVLPERMEEAREVGRTMLSGGSVDRLREQGAHEGRPHDRHRPLGVGDPLSVRRGGGHAHDRPRGRPARLVVRPAAVAVVVGARLVLLGAVAVGPRRDEDETADRCEAEHRCSHVYDSHDVDGKKDEVSIAVARAGRRADGGRSGVWVVPRSPGRTSGSRALSKPRGREARLQRRVRLPRQPPGGVFLRGAPPPGGAASLCPGGVPLGAPGAQRLHHRCEPPAPVGEPVLGVGGRRVHEPVARARRPTRARAAAR